MKTFISFKFLIATFVTLISLAHVSLAKEGTEREVSNNSKGSDVQAAATSLGSGCAECVKNSSQVERTASTTVKNPCYGVREGASCSNINKGSTDSSAGSGEH